MTSNCLCLCRDYVLFFPLLVFNFFFLSFISHCFVQSSLAHQPIELQRLLLIVQIYQFHIFEKNMYLLETPIYHVLLRTDMQIGNW